MDEKINIFNIKKYCIDNIDLLNLQQRKQIVEWLVINYDYDKLSELPNGTHVNLDKMDTCLLKNLQGKIKHLLEN
jgi:hypothetical protein